MTEVHLTDKDVSTTKAQALVLFTVTSPDGARPADPHGLAPETLKAVNNALRTLKGRAKADEVLRLAGVAGFDGLVLAVGTGVDLDELPQAHSALRDAAGAATRALAGIESAAVAVPDLESSALEAVVEGLLLGAYTYPEYKTEPTEPVASLTVHGATVGTGEAQQAAERAAIVVRSQNWARDLVNAPALDLYPASFAETVRKRLNGTKVKVSIMDEKALAKAGCGGLIGVGRGSARPPRLATLQYKPTKATRHIAIVGKGITFDSGGLCIKPATGMATMKCDMAGAAAVAGFVEAAAALELPVAITGYLCLAENMTGSDAQRPGDVIRMHDGTTVEIDNTDAEGRLVMADGLCYASEEEPDLILDIATLTGAAVLALGNRTAAVVSNNDAVRDAVIAASDRVGEHMWPMPMLEHLRPSLDSDVADIKHTGERMGGLITAAMFLKEFVGTKDGRQIDWVHLDIAAPAFNEKGAYGHTPKGGTGFAVRTLVEMARG